MPCRLVWLRSSYYFFRYAHGGRGYFRIPRRIKQSIDFFPAARVDSDLDDPRSASTDFEMLRVPLTGPYGQNVVLCWCLMQQGVDGVGSDSTTTPWRNSFMTTILAAKKLDFFFSWTCGRRTRPSKNFRTPQKRKKRIRLFALMKMIVPNEAVGIIAMAAANVSTKHTKDTPLNADVTIIASRHQPQFLSRRLLEKHEQHPSQQSYLASHPDRDSIDDLASSSVSTTSTDHRRQLLVESSSTSSSSSSCDANFLSCLLSPPCRTCFTTMQANDIDWTNVVPDTPCTDIIKFLVAGGHCLEIKNGGTEVQDEFCAAFDACVVWDESAVEGGGSGGSGSGSSSSANEESGKSSADKSILDCTTLTSCSWPGMHSQFLGDGVCHDSMPGCYNSPICKFDGGDCCEDTCHYPSTSSSSSSSTGGDGSGTSGGGGGKDVYGECGMEGYACRDPKSVKCQPVLAGVYKGFCETKADTDAKTTGAAVDDDIFSKPEKEVLPTCSSSETLFRLVQYDSWGDGWDKTILTLKERGSSSSTTPVYQGGLEYGSQGTVYLCLTKQPPNVIKSPLRMVHGEMKFRGNSAP